MDVTGIKRSDDWDIEMPEYLADDIDALVDAIARDDRDIDCYFEQVRASARGVSEEDDDRLRAYYYNGGWQKDVG